MAMTNAELIKAISAGHTSDSEVSQEELDTLDFVLSANKGFTDTLNEGKKAAQLLKDKVEEEKRKKEEEEQKLRDSLGPNQVLLTDITNNVLPKSGINHIITKYPEDTWSEEHKENIPKPDPFFYWDPNLLEDALLSYKLNTPWLCVGPPGTGKTSAGKELAALLRQPYARFNGKDGIEPAAFLGYMTVRDGSTEWKDGLMAQAVENGYYMAIDEVFKLPPGIQMAMQSLYERGGFLMLDEKPGTIKDKHIYPRPEFRILGTDNTKGTGDDLDKYPAGQMQDISTIDRFGITSEVNYLPPEIEKAMLKSRYSEISDGIIKKSIAFASLVRESFMNQGDLSLTMSPRGLMLVCELVLNGVSLERAFQMTYITKLGDDAEVHVAKKYITSVI